LNIRTTPKQEKLIQLGAELRGTSVSAFILESACLQAEHAIADKQASKLNEKSWQAFMRALDRPPQIKPALRKLFSEPSILEQQG
jgi:uncharacterized protein (DUF1778 family)